MDDPISWQVAWAAALAAPGFLVFVILRFFGFWIASVAGAAVTAYLVHGSVTHAQIDATEQGMVSTAAGLFLVAGVGVVGTIIRLRAKP